MKQKHLAAFTLLELITVLVLSTIIIGIAYTAYELIYKDFTAYKNNNESVLETLDFVTLLENDFSDADSLKIDEYSIQVFQSERTIEYELYPTNTLRYLAKNTAIIDTFNYKIRNFEIDHKTLFIEYSKVCLDCSEPSIVYLVDFDIPYLSPFTE